MKFCEKCDNMYYIGIDEKNTNRVIYYCRHCGYKNDADSQSSIVVLNTQLKKTEKNFNHIVNQYTKYDPTLPRIKNIHCPNEECSTNKTHGSASASATAASAGEGTTEVIYMRYDDDNLKYLYICVECDVTWKRSN
jgi:DNA-directed RNA polymerase subunit M/transcription elongation factor TFIIS